MQQQYSKKIISLLKAFHGCITPPSEEHLILGPPPYEALSIFISPQRKRTNKQDVRC